jgi:hypothetical protein
MTITEWNVLSMDERAKLWGCLSPGIKDRVRDLSGLTPQLIGLEGRRVEVVETAGDQPRRFNVGRSSGWRPCHIELHTARSNGGHAAAWTYHSIRVIR